MITTDIYVNVSGWTEEEVQQASEIFKDAVEGSMITDLDRCIWGYHYLMFLSTDEIFMGCTDDLNDHERKTQLAKEEVFKGMDKGDDEVTWDGVGKPPIGCEVSLVSDEEIIEVMCYGIGETFCGRDQEGYLGIFSPHHVEPIKTQSEKEIEEITKDIFDWSEDDAVAESLEEHLYLLGYRKIK